MSPDITRTEESFYIIFNKWNQYRQSGWKHAVSAATLIDATRNWNELYEKILQRNFPKPKKKPEQQTSSNIWLWFFGFAYWILEHALSFFADALNDWLYSTSTFFTIYIKSRTSTHTTNNKDGFLRKMAIFDKWWITHVWFRTPIMLTFP